MAYLLEHDDVKNIVLVLGLNDANSREPAQKDPRDCTYYKVSGESALSYYWRNLFAAPGYALDKLFSYFKDTELPQDFDRIMPENGTYDQRLNEVESIGDLDAYMAVHADDFSLEDGQKTLESLDVAMEDGRRIRQLCEEAGAELTVVLTPMYETQLRLYSEETLNEYFAKLAEVTDYWNFAISPLTYDGRYFYDGENPRNETANIVLARIFEDPDAYYPEGFGVYCSGAEPVAAESLNGKTMEIDTKNVPILLYHHLSDTLVGDTMRPETFRRHMELLKANGYETVSFDDLIAFTEHGTPLPEKPVIITFDDGYTSNYELASQSSGSMA